MRVPVESLSLLGEYPLEGPSHDNDPRVVHVHPVGSAGNRSASKSSGSRYCVFHLSSPGRLPFAVSFESCSASQRSRRSSRILAIGGIVLARPRGSWRASRR